jgi:hypothetical protein
MNMGLQAFISIDESIHPTIVLGGSIVSATHVVVNALDGEENDGVNSLKGFDSSFGGEN